MLSRSLSISYLDFWIALASVFLLILLININENSSKGNTIDPSQFLVEMSWTDDSYNDVDLWIANPRNEIVYHREREFGGMTLDTDNTGINARVKSVDGELVRNPVRREVGSIRAIVPGTYVVNVMMFKMFDTEKPETVRISLRGLNPYKEVVEKTIILKYNGQEETAFSFDIDDSGKVFNVNTTDRISLFAKLGQ